MSNQGGEPKTLGRYEVERRLAKGAMGVVYVGRDPKLDRPVAIKTLQVSDIVDRETTDRLRERFLEEPRITAQLRHPNVVPVYDAGVDPDTGIPWLALELVEGTDLAQLMKEGMTPRRVLDIADDIAAALDHAHQRGIVHRDVKPANILIDRDGRARLTDFGIAHESDAGRTRPGEFLGSPAYMAPEQIGGGQISGRTDIHALGVVLYEALTGKRPFETTKSTTTAQAVLTLMPEPPSRVVSHLPKSVDALFKKALAKAPDKRYDTAGELASDLRQALACLKPAIDHDADTTVALDGRVSPSWVGTAVSWVRSSGTRVVTAAKTVRDWEPRARVAAAAAALLLLSAIAVFAWPSGESRGSETAAGSPAFAADGGALQPETPIMTADAEDAEADLPAADSERRADPSKPGDDQSNSKTNDSNVTEAAPVARTAAPKPTSAPPEPAPAPVRRTSASERSTRSSSQATSATTQLYLDLLTTKDGVLSVHANGRELHRVSVDDMQKQPTGFRGFTKKRYRTELRAPSGSARLTLRFENQKLDAPLEQTVTWDLPAGGQALGAIEVGWRGRQLETELIETAEAGGS